MPTDTTVVLEIEASDVIHSWWIPKFGPKADAVPGYVNETWFKVPPTGGRVPRPVRRALRLGPRGHARQGAWRCRRTSSRRGRDNKREEIQQAGEALAEQRKQARGAEGN